jgi:hypothetical protein
MLDSIADSELIAELTRRRRVRVVENSTGYFSELLEDDRYMHSIDADMVRGLTRELNNKLWIRFDDVVTAHDAAGRPIRAMRKATVMVIAPEGVEDGEDT